MSTIPLVMALAAASTTPPVRAIELETKASLPVFEASSTQESIGVTMALSSLSMFGEGATVRAITATAPRLMNADEDEAAHVQTMLSHRYDEVDADPRWRDVPSPLPSAFEKRAPLLLIAPPSAVDVDPVRAPVVLFLHGYGGSGKLYAALLARALPHAWIVAPSHGVSWARPQMAYVDEVLARFESDAGFRPEGYWIVGLSDGAVGSFEILAARPERVRGVVSIVGVPRADTIARLPRGERAVRPVLMLNGTRDRFVGAKTVKARFTSLTKRVPIAKLEWFSSGHYFLIDDDGAALARIRAFIDGAR